MNYLTFLPVEDFTLKTELPGEEIQKRLSEMIENNKRNFFSPFSRRFSTKSYEGELTEKGFDVTRIINYKNSFKPAIKGTIQAGRFSTKIHVKMQLHTFVLIFSCLWCAGVGFGAIMMLTNLVIIEDDFNPVKLVPFGMLVFFYAMTMGSFKYESRKAKRDLQKALHARILTKEEEEFGR